MFAYDPACCMINVAAGRNWQVSGSETEVIDNYSHPQMWAHPSHQSEPPIHRLKFIIILAYFQANHDYCTICILGVPSYLNFLKTAHFMRFRNDPVMTKETGERNS